MQRSIIAALALVFVIAVIVIQLFFPHAAGLADNGDFGKVIAREHFESSAANGADNFIYFVRSYRFNPGFYYNAEIPSSEIALFKLSAAISRSVFAGSLDLRQHGLLHLIVFLAGLGLAARAATALPWRTFVPAVAAAAIVFSDIAYTAYLNSFYMDAAAITGLVLCFGAGYRLASSDRSGWRAVLAYGLGLLLLVSSKAQHAPLIVPGAAFLTFALWRPEVRRLRLPGALMIVAAAAGSVFVCTVSPREYSSKATFNTVFYKLLPSSPDPAGDLDSLGLPQTYMKYKGLHAFVAGGPCDDGAWLRQFSNQAGLINIAQFWLSHPGRFASAVLRDTSAFGGEIRSANLTNVERSSGLPPGSKLSSVCRWSDIKSFAIGNTGSWFLLLPGLVLGLGVYRVITLSQACRPDLPGVALGILAVATLIEITIAAGFDAIETNHHFIVMHLMMDLSILLVAGHVFGGYSQRGGHGDCRAAERGADEAAAGRNADI